MNFDDILKWLTSPSGGAVIAVSFMVSWLLEDYDWWNKLSAKVKSLSVLGMAIVIGIVATFLQLNPGIYSAIEPYIQVVVVISTAYISSRSAHKIDKNT